MIVVTYERMTPDDIEAGEPSERGYWAPGCWRHSDPVRYPLALVVRDLGPFEDCGNGRDFVETDPDKDYRTGTETRRTVHLPRNATPASVERFRRVLRAHRLI